MDFLSAGCRTEACIPLGLAGLTLGTPVVGAVAGGLAAWWLQLRQWWLVGLVAPVGVLVLWLPVLQLVGLFVPVSLVAVPLSMIATAATVYAAVAAMALLLPAPGNGGQPEEGKRRPWLDRT